VEEFLKTYLKNKRSYGRKRGYLGEKTNQKQDLEEEEEEDKQDKESDEEKDKETDEEDDQEIHKDREWARGSGWGRDPSADDMYGSEMGS